MEEDYRDYKRKSSWKIIYKLSFFLKSRNWKKRLKMYMACSSSKNSLDDSLLML